MFYPVSQSILFLSLCDSIFNSVCVGQSLFYTVYCGHTWARAPWITIWCWSISDCFKRCLESVDFVCCLTMCRKSFWCHLQSELAWLAASVFPDFGWVTLLSGWCSSHSLRKCSGCFHGCLMHEMRELLLQKHIVLVWWLACCKTRFGKIQYPRRLAQSVSFEFTEAFWPHVKLNAQVLCLNLYTDTNVTVANKFYTPCCGYEKYDDTNCILKGVKYWTVKLRDTLESELT